MSFLRLPTIGKSNRKRQYNPDLLVRAFEDVRTKGTSVYKASRIYGIPESTLRDRTLGLQPIPKKSEALPNPGVTPIFDGEEENQLLEHIAYMSSIGYGYSRNEVMNLATDYAVHEGKRTESEGRLSKKWFVGFLKRNPDVILSKAQKLSIVRAKSTSDAVLDKYFTELDSVLTQNDIHGHPEFIWNVDETGLVMEHNPKKVVCCKGQHPQSVTSNRGKTTTILACGSAAGTRLPPFYIFPGKRWTDDLLTGACPGAVGSMSESGWSNTTLFMKFMQEHFLKHVNTKDHVVVVLFDGHKSHVNLTLSEWGKANNIIFYVLPPHTSHIAQPLDVGCFGPLKSAFYSECQAFMRKNPGLQITRYNIAEISGKAYNKAITPDNLIAALRKTGISPLQRNMIGSDKTAPSVIYKESSSECNDSFLDQRKITTTKKEGVKRKAAPSVVGNICSPSKQALLKPPSAAASTAQVSSSKAKKLKMASPKPSTSGLRSILSGSDDEDSTEEVSNDLLCCVCNKSTPDATHANYVYTAEFVQWGKCDKCTHWTHLKVCTSVRFVRRHDKFLCPHCKI